MARPKNCSYAKSIRFLNAVKGTDGFGRANKQYTEVNLEKKDNRHMQVLLFKDYVELRDAKKDSVLCRVGYHNVAYWVPEDDVEDGSQTSTD